MEVRVFFFHFFEDADGVWHTGVQNVIGIYQKLFRLIQSQFKVGAVSAAGPLFDADRTSRVTPPERPQIVEDRIG